MIKTEEFWLDSLYTQVSGHIKTSQFPCALILEIGHISVPTTPEDLDWAIKNVLFAEQLCSLLIRHFKSNIRIVACIIVNNLGCSSSECTFPDELLTVLKNNHFLSQEKIHIISERNLRNIASKRLRRIAKQSLILENIDKDIDRLMYLDFPGILKDACSAIGNVSLTDENIIIPRCSSILASFIEKAVVLAQNRLLSQPEKNMLLISFARNNHELQQTVFGAYLYLNDWSNDFVMRKQVERFVGMVVLWKPWTELKVAVICKNDEDTTPDIFYEWSESTH